MSVPVYFRPTVLASYADRCTAELLAFLERNGAVRGDAGATRAKVGPNFIIIFRLSMLDLVEGGSSWEEVVQLAKAIEAAGATIINTGIGWHEARVPTIATSVPRAAFAWLTKKMKEEVKIPLITSNRINTPELAETLLAFGIGSVTGLAAGLCSGG
mgnify:CR=1 FL=1